VNASQSALARNLSASATSTSSLLQVQLVDVLLGIAASLGEDWGEELVVEAVRQVRQA